LTDRIVMLVDFDYFYAQAEEIRNPSIKDKPVVVCVYSGRSEDSGAVATANYVAREYGVKSGIPIAFARTRLKNVPNAVFLPVDRNYYEEVSRKIMNILRSYADSFEQVGIDEAYFEVSRRCKGSFEDARQLAQMIKEDVSAQEGITFSVGIGPNKLIAKIASDVDKPDGLTVVEPRNVEIFLSPMSVDRIIGIGGKTTKKLESMGIKTISDLAKYNVQTLVEVFGKNLGSYYRNAALGIDESPVQERGELESISRISTLSEDTHDLSSVLEKANQLCEEVHARLSERAMTFKSVGIVLIMVDLVAHSRSRTFEIPTNQLQVVKDVVKDLLERFLKEEEKQIRRVGVRLSALGKRKEAQESLSDFIPETKM